MSAEQRIAIVGGGPAGAYAGELLAANGKRVVLFDEKLAWEKPCGGGVTYKALQQYPFLANAGSVSNPVESCELISPSGRKVRFQLEYPVAIFSRVALNGLLLQRARDAGVEVRHERVINIAGEANAWRLFTSQGEYRAAHLVLAAGARDSFRSQFTSPFAPADLMVTVGYFIPRRSSLMQIQFLKGISGYIWIFPRTDHVSAGIAGKMGETPTAGLRRMLEDWLERNGFQCKGARFYSHILPSLRTETLENLPVSGDAWSLIGDSAGLVDPITGEGLYYAFRSAELCASAVLSGRAAEYQTRLQEDVLAELKLAARVSKRFYTGEVFGESVPERMVSLTARSTSIRKLMSDLFAGHQGYRDLRSRLYGILPSVLAQELAGSLRRPWGNAGASQLPADGFAE